NLRKLHYLKSCLDGEAALLLKNVQITAENFDISWKLLKDRFANKRRLFHIHVSNLFSLKAVTCTGSAVELRRLLDNAKESVEALKTLGHPVQDDVLVYLISQRVDQETRKFWELSCGEGDEFPTFDELEKFLNSRIRAFEAASVQLNKTPVTKPQKANAQIHLSEASLSKCSICSENHPIYKCTSFRTMSVDQRLEMINRKKLCKNCLLQMHRGKPCSSKYSCFRCGNRHQTLLHPIDVAELEKGGDEGTDSTNSGDKPSVSNSIDSTLVQSHFFNGPQPAHVVLATVWALVSSPSQKVVKVRALLDQGSIHTIISAKVAELLGTKTYPVAVSMGGIGDNKAEQITRAAPITVTPAQGTGPTLSTDALIVRSLTTYVPRFQSSPSDYKHLRGLQFADKRPTDATPVHLLIGADLYAYALRNGLRRGQRDEPVAQNTIFGWIISGNTTASVSSSIHPAHVHHSQSLFDLDASMRRFWECEEVPLHTPPTEEDNRCENHFRTTHSRSDGKYIVRIPFKEGPPISIGSTRARAERMLITMEKKLARHPDVGKLYSEFMREYEQLGHIHPDTKACQNDNQSVFLPHHSVLKSSSTTTKLRVVFNASAPSTNGKSLNDY
ncbi:hypothetical protein ALC62_07127, partial [Cyphomyrmex costatus]